MTNKRGQFPILPQNDAQTSAESFDVSLFKIGSRVQDLIFSLFFYDSEDLMSRSSAQIIK